MRLFSLLMLVGTLTVSAKSWSQQTKIDLQKQNVSVSDILLSIESNSRYLFIYDAKVINSLDNKSIDVKGKNIEEVLDQLFKGTNVAYRINDRQVFLYEKETLPIDTNTPQGQVNVKGRVTDAAGQPLPGVTVVLKGTSNGTITNEEGKFSLTNVPADATLIFSFVGMKTQEIKIGERVIVNVKMEQELVGIDEVIAIGFGKQSREVLTTSITKIDNKVFENVPYTNVASALQGTLSGVRVQTTSGMPGSTPRVIIRGGTSINSPDGATPLYIVDGIILTDISHISQDDIESIQVLKDAASTSIYGARASNGVIIIITKSGKSGKVRINYNYDLTISNNVNYYKLLSARDHITYQRMGLYNTGTRTNKSSVLALLSGANSAGTGNDLTNNTAFTTQYLTADNEYKLNEGWQSMTDPLDPSKTIIFDEFDFQRNLFRTGITNKHSISASGGTDKATFSVGAGYYDANGIVITTSNQMFNAHVNGNLVINDKLSVSGSAMYSNTKSKDPTDESTFGRSIGLSSTAKYKFEDGTLAPGASNSLGNTEYLLKTYDINDIYDDLSISLGCEWKILPGLSFDPQISIYQTTSYERKFQKAYWNGPKSYVTTRNAWGYSSRYLQKQADAVFTYNKSLFNKHNFEAKAGFSYFRTFTASVSANGNGAANDLIPTLNASATPASVSGSESEQLIYGYFGRINYDYQQKYLFSINARYDGASNLGDDYKWGLFPGISAGWNLHKETFWSSIFPNNNLKLKLRASYGVNGNISGLGKYTAQGTYASGTQYGGNATIQNTIMANNKLKWEQSNTLDFGTDLGLFNSRVNIIFDIYRRNTHNLLASLALPYSTGFTSTTTNMGSLENKGIEFELNAKILPDTNPFQWDFSFNIATVKNKILKLPYNGAEKNRVGGTYVYDVKSGEYAWKGGLQEGGKMGDYYIYKMLGVYSTDEEAASAPIDALTTLSDKKCYGGDINLADLDGDGKITTVDQVYVGNQYPNITGGFSNTFSFKNLSFLVRADFSLGHTIYNYIRATMIGQIQGDNGLSADLLHSWQQQGDVTNIPKFYYADQMVANKIYRGGSGNSMFYEKGDYLAIREVTLSYHFPEMLLQKVHLHGLSVNLTGNNLHYFTGYKGLNPEYGGKDNGRYPIPRNIILGVNVTL